MASASGTTHAQDDVTDCRLLVADGRTSPHSYDLLIDIDIDKGTFEGCAEIGINVDGGDVTAVTLHMLGLDVSRVEWVKRTGAGEVVRTAAARFDADAEGQTMTCHFAEGVVVAGKGCLVIQWSAPLSDGLCGLYKSTYVNKEGVERVMAVTQFEATDARRCFPCWDEPAAKATFDVTLVVPSDRVAISNMPVKEKVSLEGGGRIAYHYETSPVMSTCTVTIILTLTGSDRARTLRYHDNLLWYPID
jgi:puromycin-sensitive aminopeptidase